MSGGDDPKAIGEVAGRWQSLAESELSAYTHVQIAPEKIQAMARSGYVSPVVGATAPGDLILEAGCGSGSISLSLAYLERRVVALDISAGVLRNLRRNRDRLSSIFANQMIVIPLRGDLESLPFADGAFAGATNEGVVEHWLDREKRRRVLAEMARVLRPGGCLAVYVPNGRHPLVRWWEWTRYPGYAKSRQVPWHKYGWRDLQQDLEAAGLSTVDVDGLSPYSTLAVWPNWWILRALAAVLRRILPEPRWLRLRCGFNLVAWGRKKGC